jgi:PadR family transcriptional regulator, regulatory protein PadR
VDIGKDLVAASSTPLILAILADGESYGYAIVKRVGELSAGTLQWNEGMLYPLLHRLERQGYIEGSWGKAESGRKRKYYRLTHAGREQLVEQRRQWEAVDEALRNVWDAIQLSRHPTGSVTPLWQGG